MPPGSESQLTRGRAGREVTEQPWHLPEMSWFSVTGELNSTLALVLERHRSCE
jgi:hypothetical protein